jgi:hypothetical protein
MVNPDVALKFGTIALKDDPRRRKPDITPAQCELLDWEPTVPR